MGLSTRHYLDLKRIISVYLSKKAMPKTVAKEIEINNKKHLN
jgi:hypothetical protein